jgi:hypothetical protein
MGFVAAILLLQHQFSKNRKILDRPSCFRIENETP